MDGIIKYLILSNCKKNNICYNVNNQLTLILKYTHNVQYYNKKIIYVIMLIIS